MILKVYSPPQRSLTFQQILQTFLPCERNSHNNRVHKTQETKANTARYYGGANQVIVDVLVFGNEPGVFNLNLAF
ncbi:hypothetical protein AKJ16_DCAP18943 [Drosera capensis]